MENVVIFLLMLSASVLGAPQDNKCIVDGIAYNNTDPIPDGDDNICTYCYCSAWPGSIARSICTTEECWIPEPGFLNDGCIEIPKAEDQCCSEYECPEYEYDTSTVDPNAPKCFVDGIEYNDGEDIPTGDPCTECTCSAYGGIGESRCSDRICGIPDPSYNCTELPIEGQCCSDYECPGDYEFETYKNDPWYYD